MVLLPHSFVSQIFAGKCHIGVAVWPIIVMEQNFHIVFSDLYRMEEGGGALLLLVGSIHVIDSSCLTWGNSIVA